MTEGSSRYWLFGALLTVLGVWRGWLPAARMSTGQEQVAPPVSSTARVHKPSDTKSPEDTPSDGPANAGLEGGSCGCAREVSQLACACKPAPDPCVRGQELLDEYAALYKPGSLAGKPTWSRADYLLALVPDPELTNHSSTFAAVVEGVQEAVAAQGDVVSDRSWLPWGAEKATCADSAPGVMLFRPKEPRSFPPRIVLLVGETPTWGVRRKQLEAALEKVPGDTDQPLKVLGPTFSGTAASLIALLEPRGEKFDFVSGTATSPTLPQRFLQAHFSFRATVPDDQTLLGEMLEYLRKRGNSSDRIALLSEAGTAYGSNVSQTKEAQSSQKPSPLIELRFPVDLSPLRQAVTLAPPPAASAEPGTLPPEDPHVLVLDEIARDLSEQRVRFVGVVATDPADVVLLTGRLRSKIPDARFFTIGGDIQFADPNSANILNGMLIAHAAPPTSRSGVANKGAPEGSVSLKSEVVRNVYLAGRALLGDSFQAPIARVSLIGNGALWEIGDHPPRFKPPHSWWTIVVITFLLFVGTLVVVAWPWLARKLPSLSEFTLSRHRGPLSLAFSACEREDLRADDALVNAALLSVVAGATLLMLVGVYAQERTLACCLGAGVTLLACWSRVGVLAVRGELKHAQPSALACSLLATCATVLALGIACGGRHEATLNLLSGGSGVLAGLIGFTMFAIGLWCWRVRLRFLDTHRFGACVSAREPPLAQAFGETATAGRGLFAVENQLLAVIHSPWSALPIVPIAVHVLLVLSVALVYSVRAPTAFEPGWRNALVVGFGLLSLLPITVNFSRIVATWVVLTRMLKCLALFPILEPLRKLPKQLARDLEGQLTVPNADLTEFGPPIELLLQTSKHSPTLHAKAKSAETAWHAALRDQAGMPAAGETKPPGEIMTVLLDAASEPREHEKDADGYRALLVAIFIPRYLRHFRLYVVPVLVGSVLGVMMTSLYFLQPQRLISTVIFVWVAGMVVGAFLIYSSLDRSAVVSAIGNTTEGAVTFDWTLVSRILTWGIVPLLSLFAAQNSNFSSWVSVLINAFSKTLR